MNRARQPLRMMQALLVFVTLLLASVAYPSTAQAAAANTAATLAATQTGDPDGTGTIELTFDTATGQVCYTLSVANIDAPTQAHLHAGAAGSAGPVIINLNIAANGLTGCVQSTPTTVQAILAAPSNVYVNVHNVSFPDGAIRGQISGVAPSTISSSTTSLMATGDPAGSGSVDVSFDADNGQVCYTLTTTGLASAITAAHIHIGGPGSNGGVLVNLDYVAGQAEPKCVPASAADINAVVANPNGHYVNVHTTGAPAGAIRGQVAATSMSTSTASFGMDGVGFGDPDGSGTATFTLFDDGTVCYELTVADIDVPTAAHIHIGADGVQGGVLVNLDIASNSLAGCVQSTPATVAAILANPAGHYVNVHNGPFPAGAIRGQLTTATAAPAPVVVDVPLLASGDTDGSGNAMVEIDTATGRICFTLTVMNIDAVTAAHIHIGAAGTDGAVRVDLDTATNGLMGCVFASPVDAQAIADDLGAHYVNVHTVTAPAGAVRAQLDGSVLEQTPTPTPVPTPTAESTTTPTVEVVAAAGPQADPGPITNAPAGPAGPAGPTDLTTPPQAVIDAASSQAATAAPETVVASPGLALTGSETPLLAAAAFALIGCGVSLQGSGRLRRLRSQR